jgi:hypothetical protein
VRDRERIRAHAPLAKDVALVSTYPDKPETLAQFRALWDLLNSDPQIIIPIELGDRLLMQLRRNSKMLVVR